MVTSVGVLDSLILRYNDTAKTPTYSFIRRSLRHNGLAIGVILARRIVTRPEINVNEEVGRRGVKSVTNLDDCRILFAALDKLVKR